jgi:hypothetical protein
MLLTIQAQSFLASSSSKTNACVLRSSRACAGFLNQSRGFPIDNADALDGSWKETFSPRVHPGTMTTRPCYRSISNVLRKPSTRSFSFRDQDFRTACRIPLNASATAGIHLLLLTRARLCTGDKLQCSPLSLRSTKSRKDDTQAL